MTSYLPFIRSQVKWSDVWFELSPEQVATVSVDLTIPPQALEEALKLEPLIPGTSSASRIVRDRVGSDGADDVAAFLTGIDQPIGELFRKHAKRLQFENRITDAVFALCTPILAGLYCAPLYWCANPLKRTFRQTFDVWLCVEGGLLVFGAFFISIGRLVPYGHTLGSLLFASCEFIVFIFLPYSSIGRFGAHTRPLSGACKSQT